MGYEKTNVPGVFKRGSTYSVAYRDPITRKTKFQSAGSSFRDAKALKRKLEEQRERRQSSPDAQLLFSVLWTKFEESHIPTLAASTAADYRSIANRHLLPRYRRARVADIDAAEVARFRDELLKAKSATTGKVLSPKRVRNILLCLQAVYSFAVATNRAWGNPVAGLRRGGRGQMSATRQVFLTEEETAELLRSVRKVNSAHYALFFTLATTGARLSECLALEVGSIDLAKRRITISRSVFRGEVKAPKNGKTRTVGISDPLHEVLVEHLQGREGLAFASRSGGFIDPNGLRRYVFDRAVEQSELPEEKKASLRIHDLRHVAASHMAAKLPWRTVMELMGWSSTQVMLRYVHADADQAAQDGADAISSLGAKVRER